MTILLIFTILILVGIAVGSYFLYKKYKPSDDNEEDKEEGEGEGEGEEFNNIDGQVNKNENLKWNN